MRLFVAIELTDKVRSALLDVGTRLRRRCDGVRWIPAHQLHVTLKFLGEVADRDAGDVAGAVERAAANAGSFKLAIEGSGCFPPLGRVRIVWAGLKEETGRLLRIIEAMEGELELIGFARERRPFSPHITIGRVKEDVSNGTIRTAVDKFACRPAEQEVTAVTLMSSVLSPNGPTYTAVSRTNLGQDNSEAR